MQLLVSSKVLRARIAIIASEENVLRWAKLGQDQSCPHELLSIGREQRCLKCGLIFANIDTILDADFDLGRVNDLLCMSPRQQMTAMDDTFLEELESFQTRHRRAKRQWECVTSLQARITSQPQITRFKQSVQAAPPLGLFTRTSESTTAASPEAPGTLRLVSNDERRRMSSITPPRSDLLVSVRFDFEGPWLPAGLRRSVFCVPTESSVQQVLQVVARKIKLDFSEFSRCVTARAEDGSILEFDEVCPESIVLDSIVISGSFS